MAYFTSARHLIIINIPFTGFPDNTPAESAGDERRDIMKIEKVNDNQIRCTLTKEDLAERQLKISELAYGTEKAKMLFRDMMQQAAYEFGFEADDIPLMIEAIPLSADTIILLITKVDYPEELDSRFAKFSDPDPEDYYGSMGGVGTAVQEPAGADDILGMYKKIQEEKGASVKEGGGGSQASAAGAESASDGKQPVQVLVDITKLFVFRELAEVSNLAHILDGFYTGKNDLYKNEVSRKYYLLVSKSSQSPEEFNKVCNILSEYALQQSYTPAAGAFMEEHYRLILRGNALQTLAAL